MNKAKRYTLRFFPNHGWVDAHDLPFPFPRTDNVVVLASDYDELLERLNEREAYAESRDEDIDDLFNNRIEPTENALALALKDVSALWAQRDELLDALKALLSEAEGFNVSGVYFSEFAETQIKAAHAAIAKVQS